MTMEPHILLGSAAGVAVFHTVVGVDHSLPFIVLAKAERWPLRRLWAVTALCGVAHVLSSVLLALGAIGLGVAVDSVLGVEERRGSAASWLLIGFGTIYGVWATVRRARGRTHRHAHVHLDGLVHTHDHDHRSEHVHAHPHAKAATTLALFLIFVLGPCEFLVAPLMAAHRFGWPWVVATASTFSLATIGTMLAVVTLGHWGLGLRRLEFLESNMHAIAGFTIALSGFAIQALGV